MFLFYFSLLNLTEGFGVSLVRYSPLSLPKENKFIKTHVEVKSVN